MLVEFNLDPTENKEVCDDELMSNFDHEINEEIKNKLIENSNLMAGYPGWEFHGECWFNEGMFYCKVMRYKSCVGYYKAETPEELMEEISSIYGYE